RPPAVWSAAPPPWGTVCSSAAAGRAPSELNPNSNDSVEIKPVEIFMCLSFPRNSCGPPQKGGPNLCLCLEQQRRLPAPTYDTFVYPVDGRPRGAPLVLREHCDQLAARRLDDVGRAVAQIAELPDGAAQLIDARARERLLAETHLLGA